MSSSPVKTRPAHHPRLQVPAKVRADRSDKAQSNPEPQARFDSGTSRRKPLDLSVPTQYFEQAAMANLANDRLPDLGTAGPPPAPPTVVVTRHHGAVSFALDSDPAIEGGASRFDEEGARQGFVHVTHQSGAVTVEAHGDYDRGYDERVGASVSVEGQNGLTTSVSAEYQALYARSQLKASVGTQNAEVKAIAELDTQGQFSGAGVGADVSSGDHRVGVSVIKNVDHSTRIDAEYGYGEKVELSASVKVSEQGKPEGSAWVALKVKPTEDVRVLVQASRDFDVGSNAASLAVEHQLNESVRVDSGVKVDDEGGVTGLVGVNVRF